MGFKMLEFICIVLIHVSCCLIAFFYSNSLSPQELVADKDVESPEDGIVKQLLKQDVEQVLRTLSPRERDVLRMRFGFDDGHSRTLEEIGLFFKVTRERIRQIEAKAMRKLRQPGRNSVLLEYLDVKGI